MQLQAKYLSCHVHPLNYYSCDYMEANINISGFASYYYIAHQIPGRVRLRPSARPTDLDTAALEEFIACLPATAYVQLAPHSGSILIVLDPEAEGICLEPEEEGVRNPIPRKMLSYLFPAALRAIDATIRSVPYLMRGLSTIVFKRRLNLDVLDASALVVCLLSRDFRSLGSIVFFFALGDFLADWTRHKSHASLAESLALNVEEVWLKTDDAELLVPLASVEPGQVLVVRAGYVVPVDGKVVAGDGMLNQSSLTGESAPVHRTVNDSVYAGTVVEQGEVHVQVVRTGSDTRILSILRDIEESEAAKAAIQGRYELVADAIVPYNFLLSGLTFALTQNAAKAGSVLLVDYSCAIRLTTPLTILTALQEAAQHGVLIKGGKFAEALALADVVVMDKTGTLTEAQPKVVEVIPFLGLERKYVLKVAACLEEHFPHPVGQAVVRAAEDEKLKHREEHAKVELIVAHGIVSTLHGKKVILGSEHFLIEDHNIHASAAQKAIVDAQAEQGRTILYLAIAGELAGLIMIEDKLRENAAEVVAALKADGVKRVIMLTGDNEVTARNMAAKAGITEFKARLLPEDKARMVSELRAEGYNVLMLGDGINDSSAISAASVGCAMCSGADMTKEVADVVLTKGDLADLLLVRQICRRMLARISSNFRVSVLWNSLFLAGGLAGLLTAGMSALLHNATTSLLAVRSMRPLSLPAAEEDSAALREMLKDDIEAAKKSAKI